ncbi:MAG: hypothetical protein ACKO5K_03625 [Armatimonadota bacterium]
MRFIALPRAPFFPALRPFRLAPTGMRPGRSAADTFDIVSFTAPKGWKRSTVDQHLDFEVVDAKKGDYARASIFKAMPSLGGLDKDHDVNWKALAVEQLKATEAGTTTGKLEKGWQLKAGTGTFDFAGRRNAVVLLTFHQRDVQTCIVVVTNSDRWQKDIDAFLESVDLELPAKAPQPPSTPATPPSVAPGEPKFLGRWRRVISVAFKPFDPAAFSNAGYTTHVYDFRPDGTYVFQGRTFRNAVAEILVVEENGTYRLQGDQLTIDPAKSLIHSYRKRNGADTLDERTGTKERPKEKTTYKLTHHYFEGIREWNLVLQHPKETLRDGPYSNAVLFPNGWCYSRSFADKDPTARRYE